MSDAYKAYLKRCGCKGPACSTREEVQRFKEELEALEADLEKCEEGDEKEK